MHPRRDLLGLLGRKGHGHRPLVLCTEIPRSTREGENQSLRGKLERLVAKIEKEGDSEKKKKLQGERDEILTSSSSATWASTARSTYAATVGTPSSRSATRNPRASNADSTTRWPRISTASFRFRRRTGTN